MNRIQTLYKNRFNDNELKKKACIWKLLCDEYFCKYILETDRVLDIGAGYCEFINNIKCREKYAVDLNDDLKKYACSDVKTFNKECTKLDFLENNYFDKIFVSNFFEHLPNKQVMDEVLDQMFAKLKSSGQLIVLQPNIKYLSKSYWDFYDHHLPLSHLSMKEALEKTGFKTDLIKAKFLPYTVKSKFPCIKIFILIYLKLPILHFFLGKQMIIIASKP